MDEVALSFERVSELEERLIAEVPAHGAISNGALRSKLGWDQDRYRYVRDRLLQTGVLVKGRGRGGSVLRAPPGVAPDADRPGTSVLRVRERDLYDPIVSTIRSHWIPDHLIQDFVIDCTAQQGRRDTGGKWTRPDVTLASCNTFKFLPGIQLELNTFEIKTFDGLDITAVYEALAHRRAAHYSYVVAYVPESERAALKPLLDRLYLDAEYHGIGFILISKPDAYATWNFKVEPSRNDPDPEDLEDFIRTQTSENFKDTVIGWCRIV